MEALGEAGNSLAASFDPAANAWLALSPARGLVEIPVDTDWQDVPRDVLPLQASLTSAPSGEPSTPPLPQPHQLEFAVPGSVSALVNKVFSVRHNGLLAAGPPASSAPARSSTVDVLRILDESMAAGALSQQASAQLKAAGALAGTAADNPIAQYSSRCAAHCCVHDSLVLGGEAFEGCVCLTVILGHC